MNNMSISSYHSHVPSTPYSFRKSLGVFFGETLRVHLVVILESAFNIFNTSKKILFKIKNVVKSLPNTLLEPEHLKFFIIQVLKML